MCVFELEEYTHTQQSHLTLKFNCVIVVVVVWMYWVCGLLCICVFICWFFCVCVFLNLTLDVVCLCCV